LRCGAVIDAAGVPGASVDEDVFQTATVEFREGRLVGVIDWPEAHCLFGRQRELLCDDGTLADAHLRIGRLHDRDGF